MDDALILNFLRLVRNGRNPSRGSETFTFGDLKMFDNGPYSEDEEALRNHQAKKGLVSQVALVGYFKGVMVEVWRFQDFRFPDIMSSLHATPAATGVSRGLFLTEQQETSLKMLVRVIFAYLRIHDFFLEVMSSDPSNVVLQLVVNMDELPYLEADTCTKKVWAVEGLVGLKVMYNRLWRTSLNQKPVLMATTNSAASATSTTPGVIATRSECAAEQRVGSTAAQGSESLGSGRSMPTPYFAPVPLPSSAGSGIMSFSQNFSRSPTCGPSEMFLPHAVTNVSDSHVYFKSPLLGAAAAAVAARETRTRAVRGYTFASVPTFEATYSDSLSDSEGEMLSIADQLHELLEICDRATLQEASIDLKDVLHILKKKPLDP